MLKSLGLKNNIKGLKSEGTRHRLESFDEVFFELFVVSLNFTFLQLFDEFRITMVLADLHLLQIGMDSAVVAFNLAVRCGSFEVLEPAIVLECITQV